MQATSEEKMTQIVTPPPAVKIPPPPKAQIINGQQQSTEFRTEVIQTVGPKNGNGNSSRFAAMSAPARSVAQKLDELREHSLEGWEIEVLRVAPMPYGRVMDPISCAPYPSYSELTAGLKDYPGRYCIILRENGVKFGEASFTIEGQQREGLSGSQVASSMGFSRFGNVNEEDGANSWLKKKREAQAKTEYVRQARELEKEEERDTDSKDLRGSKLLELALTPHLQKMEQKLEKLSAAPKENALDLVKIAALITAITPLIVALIPKKEEKTEVKTDPNALSLKDLLPLVEKMMGGHKEDPNAQMMREMMTLMFEKRLDSPENNFKMMLEMMEKGRAQALEMIDKTAADDDGLDANAGFFNNAGMVILKMLMKVGGPMANMASQFMQTVQARGGVITPAEHQVLTQQLQALPPQMQAEAQAQMMPPPVVYNPGQPLKRAIVPTAALKSAAPKSAPENNPHPGRPAPLATPITPELELPPSKIVPSIEEEMLSTAVGEESEEKTQIAALEPVSAAAEPTPPIEAPPAQVPATNPPAAAEPADGTEPSAAELDEQLKRRVNEIIRFYLLLDLKQQVADHEWPWHAARSWPHDFKQLILNAKDHQARLDLIEAKAAPALWLKVRELMPYASANAYNIGLALNELCKEIVTPTPEEPVAV